MKWLIVGLFLAAVLLAKATGDEDTQRVVAYGVVGSAVLGLVVYTVFALALYREVWLRIQPTAIIETIKRRQRANTLQRLALFDPLALRDIERRVDQLLAEVSR